MNLLPRINEIKEKLLITNKAKINTFQLKPPISEIKIKQLSEKIEIELPSNLISILSQESNGINFSWEAESDVFGKSCSKGLFELLSLEEIISNVQDLRLQVAEAKSENPDTNEGYDALIRDYPYWIPIFRFFNGDFFCFDTRFNKNQFQIVFLEHDVMDGGPNLHGLKIAPTFEELILRWSKIAFVDLFDWSKGTDEYGINSQLPIFRDLEKAMS